MAYPVASYYFSWHQIHPPRTALTPTCRGQHATGSEIEAFILRTGSSEQMREGWLDPLCIQPFSKFIC